METDYVLFPFKIWENINKSDATLARKRTMGWVYLFLVCSINTVPLLVVSFLANLASVRSSPYPSSLPHPTNSTHPTPANSLRPLPPLLGKLQRNLLRNRQRCPTPSRLRLLRLVPTSNDALVISIPRSYDSLTSRSCGGCEIFCVFDDFAVVYFYVAWCYF